MEIGAQFYTIRDYCKNTNDFADSIKKIADIGYKYVQISGTCDYDADWLAAQLKSNGLKCVLTHIAKEKLTDDIDNVIKAHNVFECDNIGLGYYNFGGDDFTVENYNEFVKCFKLVAKSIASSGKYFMYHNHDAEFVKVGNKTILDKLAEDFTAEEMGFTLDTYWIQAGGADPAYYVEKLAGRIPCIHLKDFAYGRKMSVIGEGNINFDRVFEKARDSGTKYMIVEQDNCNGENPFDCLKRSYEYLKSRGF